MIPLFRPSCSDLEVEYVTAALRSGWWGMGPRVAELERKFAAFAGVPHAVAVSSCSAALQLVLEALDCAGGEVIVPALTFASTALAAMHAGCDVVFADVDEDTLCLSWKSAAAKRTSRTRAVIPVWYGGTVTEPDLGEYVTALDDVLIVEDCAHAAGSEGTGREGPACWSFHAVKNIAAGDGGMITTDNAWLAARLRELRWCGISKTTWDRDRGQYGWEYEIDRPGHKMHMNDLTAAVALAQLERLPALNKARKARAGQYLDELAGLGWLRLPAWSDRSSWHLFAVRVEAGSRDRFVRHMLSQGVSAGVHYKPLTHLAAFEAVPLPVTDRVWRELVTLPLYPDMTDADMEQIIAAVRGFAA